MKKSQLVRMLMASLVSVVIMQSCDDKDSVAPAPPVPDQSHVQEFDDIAAAEAAGWQFINMSETQDANTFGFVDGTPIGAPPFSGSGYLYAGYEANIGMGLISAWAVSPEVTLQNGDKISFYTMTLNDYSDPANVYPDRLQLRVSPYEGDFIGDTSYTVGGFTVNLIDVNPFLSADEATGFPDEWTKFEGTISGLNGPVKGRYALRYFVADGGTAGANSNGILVDKVEYVGVQ
jgi:hypothetical protein